jgi:hypothetical protein
MLAVNVTVDHWLKQSHNTLETRDDPAIGGQSKT